MLSRSSHLLLAVLVPGYTRRTYSNYVITAPRCRCNSVHITRPSSSRRSQLQEMQRITRHLARCAACVEQRPSPGACPGSHLMKTAGVS
ncbi:uncharacterized protein SCHCODRAFT_02463044, partial [Schizophyllum commune H4-8]|uniref:uncharacterized protein n=1 Tax=Schizophyllum commune (strain H4-8 / FGSC 9210) TaxID=578458 RepID=UPI00215F84FC